VKNIFLDRVLGGFEELIVEPIRTWGFVIGESFDQSLNFIPGEWRF